MAISYTAGYTFAASELVTPTKLNAAQTSRGITCATGVLLGRTTAGTGAVEEVTPAGARTLLGLVIGTNVQAYNANLTTYAGIAPAANVQSLLGAADYSAMRTQLGLVIGTNVQAYNANLTTYAGIAPSANVQSLLGAASYSAMRTQLGLVIGTNVQAYNANLTTYAGIAPAANVQSLLGAADYSAMRTQLGLVIGTNVQAYDADLTTWAGLTPSANAQSLVTAASYAAMRALVLPSYLETVDGTTHGWGVFSSGGVLRTARATTAAADHHIFYNSNGNVGAIQTSGSGTLYNTSSDRRLKRRIRDAADCGDRLDRVRIREYEFKAAPGRPVRGVIAQELAPVFPEAVTRGDRATRGPIRRQWMVDYSKLVPALVQEVQALRRRVRTLETTA